MPGAAVKSAARKGELTRERIVQLAAPVFNQKGYFGASMADVLRATGLQKGGIYNHFESKEQLAVEAFQFAVTHMIGRWKEAIAGKTHAASRLLAVVEMFDHYERKLGFGCPLMNTAIEADDNQPALRAKARQAMADVLRTIARAVRKGVERGEIRNGTDPELVATNLLGTLEGGLMISKLHGDPRYLRHAQVRMRAWINGELRA
jgi:AcrR family transcriptional regulator